MTKAYAVRYASFVALNVAASFFLTYLVCLWLRATGTDHLTVTLPIALLSLLVCLALFPILNRLRSPLRRLAAFYLAFNAVIIGFGLYLLGGSLLLPFGPAPVVALSQGALFGIAVGHTFGLVPFFVLVVMNAVFSRFFFRTAEIAR